MEAKMQKAKTKVAYTGEAYHQGDVQIFKVSEIPPGAKKKSQKNFFAKSEKSGHVHALCGNYELYDDPEVQGAFYVRVFGEGAVLNHTLETNSKIPGFFDKMEVTRVADHQPTFFKEGFYRVGIQRRADPFEGVWTAVKD